MRFWATIISAQMLAAVAIAQTPPEKVVSILNEVCVAPNSSEAVMAAGEKTAAQEKWELIRSGPAPTPFLHNENGAKNSFNSAWNSICQEDRGLDCMFRFCDRSRPTTNIRHVLFSRTLI